MSYRVVNEYEIPLAIMVADGSVTIDLPRLWEPLDLSVDCDGKLTLVAQVVPDSGVAQVQFEIFPTGAVVAEGLIYIGSIQLDAMLHLFCQAGTGGAHKARLRDADYRGE